MYHGHIGQAGGYTHCMNEAVPTDSKQASTPHVSPPVPSVTPAEGISRTSGAVSSAGRTEKSWLVQARLFVDDRPYGAAALLEVCGNVAAGADIDFLHEPSERYPGGGAGGMVNGFHGSRYFQDELWTGFEGEDLDATVDLGRPRQLESVSVRFLQDVNAWILLPREVRFTVSSDGVVWLDAGVVSHEVSDKMQDKMIHEFTVNLDGSPVQFVGVHGVSPGVCPDWHPGHGKPCWLFVDEIVCH